MKIETKAVHAGDRKKNPDAPGAFVPSSTPIYTATTYLYEDTAKLDRVLGREPDVAQQVRRFSEHRSSEGRVVLAHMRTVTSQGPSPGTALPRPRPAARRACRATVGQAEPRR